MYVYIDSINGSKPTQHALGGLPDEPLPSVLGMLEGEPEQALQGGHHAIVRDERLARVRLAAEREINITWGGNACVFLEQAL